MNFKHISPEMILEKITNQKLLSKPTKTRNSKRKKK